MKTENDYAWERALDEFPRPEASSYTSSYEAWKAFEPFMSKPNCRDYEHELIRYVKYYFTTNDVATTSEDANSVLNLFVHCRHLPPAVSEAIANWRIRRGI